MKTTFFGAEAFNSPPAIAFRAARTHQCLDLVDAKCSALVHRLQQFALELLAAIVVMAILMIVTGPETRKGTSV